MTRTLIRVGLALVVLLAVASVVGIASAEMTPDSNESHNHSEHQTHDRASDEHLERHSANGTASDCHGDGPHERHGEHRADRNHSQHDHQQQNQHGQHGADDQHGQHGTQGQHTHGGGPADGR